MAKHNNTDRTSDSAAIGVDSINLDEAGLHYTSFLRSVRMLRGAAAAVVGATVVIFVIFPVAMMIGWIVGAPGASLRGLLFMLGAAAVFLLLSHLYLYAFRMVAAGSIRAIRLLLSVLGLLMISDSLIFVSAVLGLLRQEVVVLTISASIFEFGLYLLIATGLLQALRFRRSPLFPLLIDRNWLTKFRFGVHAMAEDIRALVGLPGGQMFWRRKCWRASAAALGAFILEAGVFAGYFTNTNRLMFESPESALPEIRRLWGADFDIWVTVALALSPVVVLPSVRIFFALGRILRRYSRRRALVAADEARLLDPRPPVLFLRSFSDDQVSLANARPPWLLGVLDPGAIAGTLEELVVQEYAHCGPVITIGNPADQFPALGAARQYCRGEDWRTRVQSLMVEAGQIVIGTARSDGLAWEIRTVRRLGLMGKTIVLFSPKDANDSSSLDGMLELLELKSATTSELRTGARFVSLSFPAPDRGLLFTSNRLTEVEYQLALRVPWLNRGTLAAAANSR